MDKLYWEIYMKYPEDFAAFIEKTTSFLHLYLGDMREAVAHSEQISKFGRVIYNEAAWDTAKFTEIKEDITQPNHYEVVKEVILRVNKYKCSKVDIGYIGRWKNPYQIADTHLPTGITVTYEKQKDCFTMHTELFTPGHWFALLCKPLFRTDPIVEKDPKGSWNMNPVGLIAPKPEKTAANRRSIFGMFNDFVKDFYPDFAGLALSQIYFNPNANNAYMVDPEAKNNELLYPLAYFFKQAGGNIHFSDSSEVPKENFNTIQVKDERIFFDKKHFDFF
jgi:hypothetical protein